MSDPLKYPFRLLPKQIYKELAKFLDIPTGGADWEHLAQVLGVSPVDTRWISSRVCNSKLGSPTLMFFGEYCNNIDIGTMLNALSVMGNKAAAEVLNVFLHEQHLQRLVGHQTYVLSPRQITTPLHGDYSQTSQSFISQADPLSLSVQSRTGLAAQLTALSDNDRIAPVQNFSLHHATFEDDLHFTYLPNQEPTGQVISSLESGGASFELEPEDEVVENEDNDAENDDDDGALWRQVEPIGKSYTENIQPKTDESFLISNQTQGVNQSTNSSFDSNGLTFKAPSSISSTTDSSAEGDNCENINLKPRGLGGMVHQGYSGSDDDSSTGDIASSIFPNVCDSRLELVSDEYDNSRFSNLSNCYHEEKAPFHEVLMRRENNYVSIASQNNTDYLRQRDIACQLTSSRITTMPNNNIRTSHAAEQSTMLLQQEVPHVDRVTPFAGQVCLNMAANGMARSEQPRHIGISRNTTTSRNNDSNNRNCRGELQPADRGHRSPVVVARNENLKSSSSRTGRYQISVFLTYSNDVKRSLIANLCDCLKVNGFKVGLDTQELKQLAQDRVGLYEKKLREVDFVLVLISPNYLSDVEADMTDPRARLESSLNTFYIHKWMHTDVYETGLNRKYIPVVVPQATRNHIPVWLRNTIIYKWPADYNSLLGYMTNCVKLINPMTLHRDADSANGTMNSRSLLVSRS